MMGNSNSGIAYLKISTNHYEATLKNVPAFPLACFSLSLQSLILTKEESESVIMRVLVKKHILFIYKLLLPNKITREKYKFTHYNAKHCIIACYKA